MAKLNSTIVQGSLRVTDEINASAVKVNGTNVLTSHQSVSSSNNTASFGSAVVVGTVGGTELKFTMPANPNSNTWRKIQLNGTDKLGTGTGTNPLNIKAGSNMTITESGGTFTFAATDTTYSVATQSANGLMSSTDKTRVDNMWAALNGSDTTKIDTIAEVYAFLEDYAQTTDLAAQLGTKITANSAITGATKCKITYDSKGLVTGGADLVATDIPELGAGKITTGTFDIARIPTGTTGSTVALGNHTHSYLPLSGTSDLTGSISPKTDNSINLGSASYKFANIYGTNVYGTTKVNTPKLELESGQNRATFEPWQNGDLKIYIYDGANADTTVYLPNVNSNSETIAYESWVEQKGYTSNAGTVTSVRVQAGTGLSSSTSTAQTSSLNTTISIASGYKLPTTTEWSGKQDALTAQTAYSAKGSATKVPQITTNSLGQVTGITEVDISYKILYKHDIAITDSVSSNKLCFVLYLSESTALSVQEALTLLYGGLTQWNKSSIPLTIVNTEWSGGEFYPRHTLSSVTKNNLALTQFTIQPMEGKIIYDQVQSLLSISSATKTYYTRNLSIVDTVTWMIKGLVG